MDALEALARSLPESAEQIRRRFWCDAEFRAVCADYRDAAAALAGLEQGHDGDSARTEEYRQLAAEMLAEATAMLKGERR
jgi:hypothetical protein